MESQSATVINVGVSGPGVVKTALEKVRGESFEVLCETIKKTAFKVTRVGQLVAKEACKMFERCFLALWICPLHLRPQSEDSVADILCEIGLEYAGAPGTTAALATFKRPGEKRRCYGVLLCRRSFRCIYSGERGPGTIDAVRAGALTLEKLEAMTCVCSVGLDMIAVPETQRHPPFPALLQTRWRLVWLIRRLRRCASFL